MCCVDEALRRGHDAVTAPQPGVTVTALGREEDDGYMKGEMLTVADLMTREVFTLPASLSLDGAAWALMHRGVSGAPVCDDDGKVVGVLSETELLEARVETPDGAPSCSRRSERRRSLRRGRHDPRRAGGRNERTNRRGRRADDRPRRAPRAGGRRGGRPRRDHHHGGLAPPARRRAALSVAGSGLARPVPRARRLDSEGRRP